MKAIVIGLGSMGKRRIRNLKENGVSTITGFDLRADRCEEASNKYGITTVSSVDKNLLSTYDVVVISTPPDMHMKYAFMAHEAGRPCFVEASVTDWRKIQELAGMAKHSGIVVAPSCTMKYFPGPRKVRELLGQNKIGKILYGNYTVGQWLPDWHPWEDIKDYYVSRRETGGAREILPFELTWLNDMWGQPDILSSYVTKLSQLTVDIDDYYTTVLRYPTGPVLNLTIEVLSRPKATREMRLIGSEGIIDFSADQEMVTLTRNDSEVERFILSRGSVEAQYINPEEPYIAEIKDFLDACQGKKPFPNTLEEDVEILRLLENVEKKSVQ